MSSPQKKTGTGQVHNNKAPFGPPAPIKQEGKQSGEGACTGLATEDKGTGGSRGQGSC